MTPDHIATAKSRSIREFIGKEVKLQRAGHEWKGCCPFHEDRSPSFYVNDEKGLYNCFGCGASGDLLDYAQEAYSLSFVEAVERIAGDKSLGRLKTAPAEAPDDTAERMRKAQQIWTASMPIHGTIAETYLRARGISTPLPDTLRFNSHTAHSTGLFLPAMIAAINIAPERKIVAVHQTFLTHDGSAKIPLTVPRLTIGPAKGGAVQLAPWREGPLVIGEGIETTLSAMQMWSLPGWAARADTGYRSLALPPECRDIIIAADHDRNGAGQALALRAAEQWRAQGRTVHVRWPSAPDTDWNDVLLAGRNSIGPRISGCEERGPSL